MQRSDLYATGKVVRIAPNHISIADPEALQIVYAVRHLASIRLSWSTGLR